MPTPRLPVVSELSCASELSPSTLFSVDTWHMENQLWKRDLFTRMSNSRLAQV